MKSLMLLPLVFFGLSAFAEIKTEIDQLHTVSFDGTNLQVSYFVGGGCATHTPVFEVDLVEVKASRYEAKVKVFDSVPDEDLCLALLLIDGEVNLKELIKQKATQMRLPPEVLIEVVLPKVLVTLEPDPKVRTEVQYLQTLKFDGSKLHFSYRIGGGCETHKAVVELDFVKVNAHHYEAHVLIFDSTPQPDFCEALLTIESSVDLELLVQKRIKKLGLHDAVVAVVLPKVLISAN